MKVFDELRKAGIDSHDIEQLEKFYGGRTFYPWKRWFYSC